MKAICWYGPEDVRLEEVPDPRILNPRDAVVKVTSTAICGSDLHIYDGDIPSMRRGDVLGHEFMGEVVEVGPEVDGLAVGARVVVPFPIACGGCFFCRRGEFSLCDNSNPRPGLGEAMMGHATAGIFGYSHLMGGYAGGQAEYVRVPFADVGPIEIPEGLDDEQVLFLSDILPTGWQAAEQCGIEEGDTVAVWGCGPVGQFAIRSALLQGAGRVVAIDDVAERLDLAEAAGALPLDRSETSVLSALDEITGGRGPDRCIEAVGMEAHGDTLLSGYDRVKQAVRSETGRPIALREAILACRKGGTLSVAGVFGGLLDKIPMGAAFNKSLTFRMGQTHVHRYLRPLLERIEAGDVVPAEIITHRLDLEDGPEAYRMFREKADGCVKVVLTP